MIEPTPTTPRSPRTGYAIAGTVSVLIAAVLIASGAFALWGDAKKDADGSPATSPRASAAGARATAGRPSQAGSPFVVLAFMVGGAVGTDKLTTEQSGVGESGRAAKLVDGAPHPRAPEAHPRRSRSPEPRGRDREQHDGHGPEHRELPGVDAVPVVLREPLGADGCGHPDEIDPSRLP